MSASYKFTASTATTSLNINAKGYVIKNDGTADIYWNTGSEVVGVASTDAPLKSGESISVNEIASRFSCKTASGTATVRLFTLSSQ